MSDQQGWIDMSNNPKLEAVSSLVPHRIRPYQAGDEALVYKSYLRSFLRTGYRIHMAHGLSGESISTDVYYAGQRSVLEEIMRHARISIACGLEDEWQVLGFLIYDDLPSGLVLHYIYVKRMFRKARLASEMVKHHLAGRGKLVNTHFTAPWRFLSRSLTRANIDIKYDPYLAR